MIVLGAMPPNPRDLAPFLPEWIILLLLLHQYAVHWQRLIRRIGQRRDATRAPIQVRNGWRSHDRLLLTRRHTI